MARTIKQGSTAFVLLATVVVVVVGVGCGGDGDGSKNSKYVGTWQYDGVTQSIIDCGANGMGDVLLASDKTFQDGIGVALVDVSPSPIDFTSCNLGYDVMGMNATIHAGESCALTNPNLVLDPTLPVMFTPAAGMGWRFTLTGPNKAEEVGTAAITNFPVADPADPTGQTALLVTCTYKVMATLSRVATD